MIEYNRVELAREARKMGFVRDTFEKALRLKEILKYIKSYIAELMKVTPQERQYMEAFAEKEYIPELLFEDQDMIERIKEHPMALWKCRK